MMAGVAMRGQSVSPISYTLTHGPSGAEVISMAPVDNGGDGSSFSPTDLFSVSLGACAATIMGLYAQNKGFSFGLQFSMTKTMQAQPRRVSSLELVYRISSDCSAEEFERLKRVASACPVRLSLHPDILIKETFERI